jgi:hypothetical protein
MMMMMMMMMFTHMYSKVEFSAVLKWLCNLCMCLLLVFCRETEMKARHLDYNRPPKLKGVGSEMWTKIEWKVSLGQE